MCATCGCGKKGAMPYNKKSDKSQDKKDTKNLSLKGKAAFEKSDKKQPKSTKDTMSEDRAWDKSTIKKIAKKPGMAKKK